MLLKRTNDWKEFLSYQDEERLNEILKKVAKYRGAYKNADDVKMAQMWCAVLDLKKENLILQKRLNKLQFFFDGMLERVRKQESEDMEMIKNLERF